jgi:hypothetical protein
MKIERFRCGFAGFSPRVYGGKSRFTPTSAAYRAPGRSVRISLALVALSLCSLALVPAARAQGVQTVLHARSRVFQDIGAGAAKIARDPVSGHYYVLAKPETLLAIYSPDGKRIGQLPNENSGAVGSLNYAVDFDVDAKGRVYVADRGDNRVKIFAPDGSLEGSVYVNAPMSVVALPNDQFAVVTLRTDHLVRVMDIHGKLVRTFGSVNDALGTKTPTSTVDNEPQGYSAGYNAQYAAHTPETFAMNIGRVYGDQAGHIFFAFTLLDDPTFRKYDPYGYSLFESTVPAQSLIPDIDRGDARVQVGMNVSGMAGMGNFFSFGTMYSVGGNADFTVRGGSRGGGGGGRHGGGAGGAGTGGGSGSGGSGGSGSGSGGSGNGGSGGSKFSSSGYSTTDSGTYATDSSGLFSASSDSTTFGNNGNLAFDSSTASVDPDDASALLGVGGMASMYGASGSNLVFEPGGPGGVGGPPGAGTPGGYGGIGGPGGFGGPGGPGGPGGFLIGGPGGGFHGGGGFGGPGGFGGTQNEGVIGATEASIPTAPPAGAEGKGGANIAGGGATTPTAPPKPGGAAPTESGGRSYGGGHGDYAHGYGHNFDMHTYSAVVKFNQVEKDLRAKPVIHAIGADPASNDVWVTIGDVLMHFDSSGNREDSYVVTTNTGAPLSPVGILVEPNRLLLVGDPTGIYDFARPDKADRTSHRVAAATQSTATPDAPPQNSQSFASTPASGSSPKTNVAPGTPVKNTQSPQ